MKICVFINNSAGELDWIIPYLELSDLEFELHIILYQKKLWDKKIDIPTKNTSVIFGSTHKLHTNIDFFLDNLFRKINRYNFLYKEKTMSLISFLIKKIRFILSHTIKHDEKYDYIFRDYNLVDSIFLLKLLRNTKSCIVFPHSTALMTNFGKKPKLNHVECKYFIENTIYHDRFLPLYKKEIRVVGCPPLDKVRSIKLLKNKKKILVITRNCDEKFFGFNYDDSFKELDKILSWANHNNYSVDIKHHPRDSRVKEWRKVTDCYEGINEISHNLAENNIDYFVCFCFYTSAFIPILAQNILCLDISPYKQIYFNKLPYHKWVDGPTHEFRELDLLPIIEFDVYLTLSSDYLDTVLSDQHLSLEKIYMPGSIARIDELLVTL